MAEILISLDQRSIKVMHIHILSKNTRLSLLQKKKKILADSLNFCFSYTIINQDGFENNNFSYLLSINLMF